MEVNILPWGSCDTQAVKRAMWVSAHGSSHLHQYPTVGKFYKMRGLFLFALYCPILFRIQYQTVNSYYGSTTRVRLGNEDLSFVEEFRYLGHVITADCRDDKDIKK